MRAKHVTAAEIQAYAQRRLSPDEALEISDHLVQCAPCRALLRQAEQFHPQARRTDAHASYEEIADFVDDKLDPLTRRELLEKLSRSPAARREAEDLAEFKQHVAATASQPARPVVLRPKWTTWAMPLAAALVAAAVALSWNAIAYKRGMIALHDNGARVHISRDGSVIRGEILPPELRASLKSAIAQNRMQVAADVSALRGKEGTLAGERTTAPQSMLIGPVATAVEETSLELRWRGDARATGYRVTIARNSDDAIIATAEVPKEQLTWRPTTQLERGVTYAWQVEALQNGSVIAVAPTPPQPQAKFRVLAESELQQLNDVRQPLGKSHIALALADAHAGLVDAADAELAALEAENPGSTFPAQLRAALRNGVATP